MATTRKKPAGIPAETLLAKERWDALPAFMLLVGRADFFKSRVIDRLVREIFRDGPREVRREQGPLQPSHLGELPLASVLDDLRTPSFLAPARLVVIERADLFLATHAAELEPFVEPGFGNGYLVLALEKPPDQRTRLARALKEHAWLITCDEPYDRPAPWETRKPIWDSPLSHWLSRHAATKSLELDPQTAFALHQRIGGDLALLDEELEKISTYLAAQGERRVDEDAVRKVAGDLREDSVFSVVELLLEGRRADSVHALERLFRRGYRNEQGALVVDASSIAILLVSSMLLRLRSLRRAHAMAAEGARADDWITAGLVRRPFLAGFERHLRANPPARIAALIDGLFDIDRGVKTGSDPRELWLLLAAS